jgi:hypothetical protein
MRARSPRRGRARQTCGVTVIEPARHVCDGALPGASRRTSAIVGSRELQKWLPPYTRRRRGSWRGQRPSRPPHPRAPADARGQGHRGLDGHSPGRRRCETAKEVVGVENQADGVGGLMTLHTFGAAAPRYLFGRRQTRKYPGLLILQHRARAVRHPHREDGAGQDPGDPLAAPEQRDPVGARQGSQETGVRSAGRSGGRQAGRS